jgi:hypothetical protein
MNMYVSATLDVDVDDATRETAELWAPRGLHTPRACRGEAVASLEPEAAFMVDGHARSIAT